MRVRSCPGCDTLIGDKVWFCGPCTLAFIKYGDENPDMLRAYLDRGMVAMVAYLCPRAAFADWLAAHKEEP